MYLLQLTIILLNYFGIENHSIVTNPNICMYHNWHLLCTIANDILSMHYYRFWSQCLNLYCKSQPQPNPNCGLSLFLVLINSGPHPPIHPSTHPESDGESIILAIFILKVKCNASNVDNWIEKSLIQNVEHNNTKLLRAKFSIVLAMKMISLVLMINIIWWKSKAGRPEKHFRPNLNYCNTQL